VINSYLSWTEQTGQQSVLQCQNKYRPSFHYYLKVGHLFNHNYKC